MLDVKVPDHLWATSRLPEALPGRCDRLARGETMTNTKSNGGAA